MKSDEKLSKQNEAREGYRKVIFLLAAFAVILAFRSYVMERVIISGNSMFPRCAMQTFVWRGNWTESRKRMKSSLQK